MFVTSIFFILVVQQNLQLSTVNILPKVFCYPQHEGAVSYAAKFNW